MKADRASGVNEPWARATSIATLLTSSSKYTARPAFLACRPNCRRWMYRPTPSLPITPTKAPMTMPGKGCGMDVEAECLRQAAAKASAGLCR